MSIFSVSDIGINYISNNYNIHVANAKSETQRINIPFILPSPIKKMTDTNPTMEATATYATKTFWDLFESGLYTLKGGQISPNGKWKDIYTGWDSRSTPGSE